MRRIRVKNFGPIREGFGENDGWMDIRKVTFFIGNNGTGKSSVAKLVSTFSWLEKALFQGRLSERELYRVKSLERYTRYHKIESYFSGNTEVDYEGDGFTLTYRAERLTATRREGSAQHYKVPKIMYAGSERNFLAVASKPDKIAGLPQSLGTFLDEFRDALEKLTGRLPLPIGDVTLSYQKQARIAQVHGPGDAYTIRLTEASSGIQSAAPLFVVCRYLAQMLKEEADPATRKRTSEEDRRYNDEIKRILKNTNLPQDMKERMLELLAEQYKTALFLNVVEEPEQNLFPDSQRGVLNALLDAANSTAANELVVTTHSPYLLSYLSLAIKAAKVLEQIKSTSNSENLVKRVAQIVPIASGVKPEQIAIYEMNADGSIALLETYGGIPSDENDLNERLAEINELFADLVEIRQEA